jgi:hypothetical protein
MRIDELLNKNEFRKNNKNIYFSIIDKGEPIKVNGPGGEELHFNYESEYQSFIEERGLDTGSSENIRLLEFHIKH